MDRRHFDNVRDQIGFCGIWCGSCPGGNGAVVDLTRLYEEQVRENQLEKWGPKDFDFKEFMKGLASIGSMQLCPGCRKGGGPPDCIIRTCATGKGLEDCSRCGGLDDCQKFEFLMEWLPTIKEGLKKIKARKKEEIIEEWAEELKTRWPHCVLTCQAINRSTA